MPRTASLDATTIPNSIRKVFRRFLPGEIRRQSQAQEQIHNYLIAPLPSPLPLGEGVTPDNTNFP